MFASRAGRRLLLITTAAAAAAAIVPLAAANASPATTAAASSCPACGHNLIANPGAEKGRGADSDIRVNVPDWKQTGSFTAVLYTWSGGDLSPTSPGPRDRGKNYFYGGPEAAKSTGTQKLTIAAGGVRGGKVDYTLSGWLGGYDSQGDNAVLTVTFENSHGGVIGSAKIGPVTPAQRKDVSELLFRAATGKVPAGTRSLKIELVMTREAGSDNDGIADNLSLVFKLR
jgi:hypothetical protein